MPTGPGPVGQGEAPWWAVLYVETGQVSSRYDVNPVPGVKFIQAPDRATAEAALHNQLTNATVTGILGPFTTRQQAQDATSKDRQRIAKDTQAGKFPNPLSGLDEIGAVLEAFFAAITDLAMWRCLGLIIAGAILFAVGVRLWLGLPALPSFTGGPGGAIPPIVPV